MSGITALANVNPPSDSLTLDSVVINGHRYQAHSSINLINANLSQRNFQNLGELLEQSGVSVRSNGVGQLTLASIRGLYGNQMNLLWEGINIQSPMNGNFDLSLIPVFFLDNASLVQNNYSSLSGNSALSGSIAFGEKKPLFGTNKYSAYFALGSFGKRTGGTDITLSNNRLYSRTRIFATRALNNYPIIGYEQTPFRKEQINNDFLSYGVLQELAIHTGKKSVFNIKAWLQATDRGLTDAISVPNPRSRQEDEIKRIYVNWESNSKNNLYVKMAYFDEKIIFTDNQSNVYHNKAQTFVLDAGKKVLIGQKSRLNFGVNEVLNRGVVREYNGIKTQNLLSGFVSFESKLNKINYTFSVREQFHNDRVLLPAPAIELYSFLYKKTKLRASSGLSYRVPTFNDLYWTPGGNLDLVNEQAFKNEIGADYIHKKLIVSLSVYHNELSNLIVWQDNGTFWEAKNIRGARVLGTELKIKTAFINNKNTELNIGGFGALNHSVYTITEDGSEDIIGNQLIFIPLETANGFINLKFRNLYINIVGNYSGKRYISTDNSTFLEHYFLADINFNYKYKIKKAVTKFGLTVNNVFNKGYELYLGRPMMGRSFLISMAIDIQ
ncbi:MAG: TonB-dependent receptor [Bacteroidetes bacterium]|nr:TonB-dependent receptor [Bacteroidota bacterium]